MEALLADGKTRDAVETAKQLLKIIPGPETEALAVRAYQARIQALLASGMHREAQALITLVSERFPAYKTHLAPFLRQISVSADHFEALLSELPTADAERRRELEAILTRGLRDPAILADSSVLPAEFPLRRMACTVRDLFVAVTTGPLPENSLAPLHEIPRHSPLAPWKLLIRALDAFYRRADAAVAANLAGIPPDAGPAPLVPVLRRLSGENDSQNDRSFAVATLLDKVTGNRTQVRATLAQLSHAIAAHDERKAVSAVQALLPVFQATPPTLRQTFFATVLQHWHRQGLPPERLLRALPGSRKDPDLIRLIALTLEHTAWDIALEWWDSYVKLATAAGTLPKRGPELARVLLHLVALFPPDLEEVLDFFDVENEQAFRQLLRTGALPASFDRGALLERAREADPDPQVFRALVAHYEQWGDVKRAESEAEAWRRAHPQDLEPLLHLIRAAERRNAFRKALELLTEAETLNRVHPDVRQSRFRLLLASAERRLKEGKAALALEDIERLTQEPRAAEGDRKAYLWALCWAAAQKTGDAAGVARLEETLMATVENSVFYLLLLQAVATSLKIEHTSHVELSPPPQAIDGLVRACELFRALDRPFTVSPAILTYVEKNLGSASPIQLHSLSFGGLRLGCPTLTYAASGQGLAQDGPLLHRFLLARGQILRTCWGEEEIGRARHCLLVARELASRARDLDAVRDASTALDDLPDWAMFNMLLSGGLPPAEEKPPTPEEITHVIARERGAHKLPQFPRRTPPRAARRRKPPRQRMPRDLLDDLFSLLEGRL